MIKESTKMKTSIFPNISGKLGTKMSRPAFVSSIPVGLNSKSFASRGTCETNAMGIPLVPRINKRACTLMCERAEEFKGQQQPKPRFKKELTPEVKELKSVLKKCSIYLIGPMGTGKSAVGRYLASELGFRFLDTDQLIENVARKSIPKIFEDDGEETFRDLESAILDQVAAFIGCCVATGGGAVLRKENWGKLQTGIVVYLETPIDVLNDRLMSDNQRPLLKNMKGSTLRERIRDILEERRHLYKQADLTVHVERDMPVDDVGKEVIRLLTNFIKANPPRSSALYANKLPKKGQ